MNRILNRQRKNRAATFTKVAPKSTHRAVSGSLKFSLQQVSELQRLMDADQAEIERLRASTQSNLAKAKAILDTL